MTLQMVFPYHEILPPIDLREVDPVREDVGGDPIPPMVPGSSLPWVTVWITVAPWRGLGRTVRGPYHRTLDEVGQSGSVNNHYRIKQRMDLDMWLLWGTGPRGEVTGVGDGSWLPIVPCVVGTVLKLVTITALLLGPWWPVPSTHQRRKDASVTAILFRAITIPGNTPYEIHAVTGVGDIISGKWPVGGEGGEGGLIGDAIFQKGLSAVCPLGKHVDGTMDIWPSDAVPVVYLSTSGISLEWEKGDNIEDVGRGWDEGLTDRALEWLPFRGFSSTLFVYVSIFQGTGLTSFLRYSGGGTDFSEIIGAYQLYPCKYYSLVLSWVSASMWEGHLVLFFNIFSGSSLGVLVPRDYRWTKVVMFDSLQFYSVAFSESLSYGPGFYTSSGSKCADPWDLSPF